MDKEELYKKKILSKNYNRNNWGPLAILFQIGGATLIATALQFAAIAVILANSSEGFTSGSLTSSLAASNEYALVFTGIAYVIVNAATAVLVLKWSKTGKLRDYIKKPETQGRPWLLVLGILAPVGLSGLDSIFMRGLDSIFGSSSTAVSAILTSGLFSDKLWVAICSILYVALLGPVTEELLLRGCVLPTASHISPAFGMITSGILFGLMHANISQFFNATLMGILMAYVALKFRSIVPTIIAHVINNSIAIVQTFVTKDMSESATAWTNNCIDGTLAVIGIIALIILVRKLGTIDNIKDKPLLNMPYSDEEYEYIKGKYSENALTYKSWLGSWALWLVVAYAAFNSILIGILGMSL